MNNVGKHRGWLLVYEIQYWISFFLVVFAFSILRPMPTAGLFGTLFVVGFLAVAILSLYWSAGAVRRGHIIVCWSLAAGAFVVAINNSPHALDSAVWRGEFLGSSGFLVLWIMWALYWQKSERVKNSYPAIGKTANT